MNSDRLTIYEPDTRHKIGFLKVWAIMFRNIIMSRELIYQLFKRDFIMAYKKSFLGIGWILLQPIIGIISWVFMNKTGVLQPGDVGIPYPAYVLLSTSIWGLFVGFFTSASETLGAGAGFILQVKFPHEALLIKQTAQQVANFIVGFALTIAVLVFFGVVPDWKTALLPVLVLPLFFLGAGIGLMVSMINVVAVDIQKGSAIIIQILMYFTPVVYSPKVSSPLLQKIIAWNPLTYLVGGVRDLIIYGRMDFVDRYLYAAAFSFIIFMLSWRLFFVSEDKVIEKII
ncbi:MAG TPA: ABC transporter permease [Spirochaetota bacterium]|nr:ABC transporter permease [Spirochaetota bacterium]